MSYAKKSTYLLPLRWTEFAITNGILSHLNVEGARLSTIVYFNVDVILAASTVVVVLFYLLARVAKFILVGPAHKRTVKTKKQWQHRGNAENFVVSMLFRREISDFNLWL